MPFTYEVQLVIPPKIKTPQQVEEDQGGDEFTTIQIAEYDFNPGLKEREEFIVDGLKLFGESFSFPAVITKIRKEVRPNNLFATVLVAEAIDREKIVEYAEKLKKTNPDLFE